MATFYANSPNFYLKPYVLPSTTDRGSSCLLPPPPKTTLANTASEVKSSSCWLAHMDTAQNNVNVWSQMLKWLQAWMLHICHRDAGGRLHLDMFIAAEFWRKVPRRQFLRCTQKKEHDQGGVTSHTVNALGRVSIRVSLAFRVGFSVLPWINQPILTWIPLTTSYQDSIFQPNLNPSITLLFYLENPSLLIVLLAISPPWWMDSPFLILLTKWIALLHYCFL